MRVLHVDDDFMIRELVRIGMGDCGGHEVFSFADGPAAIDHLDANQVDLIISDVMMPGMNGPDFVRAVRGRALSSAPVIFLTGGYRMGQPDLEALTPLAIMAKPFSPFTLSDDVCRCLCDPSPAVAYSA